MLGFSLYEIRSVYDSWWFDELAQRTLRRADSLQILSYFCSDCWAGRKSEEYADAEVRSACWPGQTRNSDREPNCGGAEGDSSAGWIPERRGDRQMGGKRNGRPGSSHHHDHDRCDNHHRRRNHNGSWSIRTGDDDRNVDSTKLIAEDKRATWLCEIDMISGSSCPWVRLQMLHCQVIVKTWASFWEITTVALL